MSSYLPGTPTSYFPDGYFPDGPSAPPIGSPGTAPIVTRGFLFTIGLVVTAGYVAGVAPPPPPPVTCIPFRSEILVSVCGRSAVMATVGGRSAVLVSAVSRSSVLPDDCAGH